MESVQATCNSTTATDVSVSKMYSETDSDNYYLAKKSKSGCLTDKPKNENGGDSDSELEHFEDAVETLDLSSSNNIEYKTDVEEIADSLEYHETELIGNSQVQEMSNQENVQDESQAPVSSDSLQESCNEEQTSSSTDGTIDEEMLKNMESKLTEEEKQKRKEESRRLKDLGNVRFKEANYVGAIESYTDALMSCLLSHAEDRAIIYSNRAAAYMKLEKYEDAINDSSKALEYNPDYMKALLRRAELYERAEKLDEALEDYKKALEKDPSLHQARAACMRLPDQINERNEKLKTEMMGKLKDLGNLILRPFGLSTNNFKLQQDPSTGSYNVSFQQSQ